MLTRRNTTTEALGFAFLLILWINEISVSVSNSPHPKLATDSSGALFTQMTAEHTRLASSIRSPITQHHISFDWVNYSFCSHFSKSQAAMSIKMHLENTTASYKGVFQHPPRLSKKVQYTALPLISLLTSMYRQTLERLKRSLHMSILCGQMSSMDGHLRQCQWSNSHLDQLS